MKDDSSEIVIPVLAEHVHVDTVPVLTGGVRIVKRLESHDELVEQQLRVQNVEVTRIPVNRIVDGPQAVVRTPEGDLIIPVVEEILKIERQWVVREEIHISRLEKLLDHRETVSVTREEVEIERYGNSENPV